MSALDKLESIEAEDMGRAGFRSRQLIAALRAVLEIHKETKPAVGGDDEAFCPACLDGDEFPEHYPCPTVQAIEDALK